MALHLAPRRPRPMAAILGFSGALIGAANCSWPRSGSRPPVMLIHGDDDDVVPVDALFEATAGLHSAEIPVQWVVRPNLPHSIDPEGIAVWRALSARDAGAARPPGWFRDGCTIRSRSCREALPVARTRAVTSGCAVSAAPPRTVVLGRIPD